MNIGYVIKINYVKFKGVFIGFGYKIKKFIM